MFRRVSSKSVLTKQALMAIGVAVLVCITGADAVRAVEGSLPHGSAILDKYIDATGGKAAYEKNRNRVSQGRVVHVGMDFEDKLTIYMAAPDKRYVEIDSDAFGMIQNGSNGKVSWYLADNTGPMVEQGEAQEIALRQAAFHAAVRWREFYKKAECVGEKTIDGKQCYEVLMTPNVGGPETLYFDAESSLLVQKKATRISSWAPPTPMEFTFSDYKAVDGVLIPHKVRRVFSQCGSKREMLFVTDSLEHNADLPAGRFDLPREIVAVLKNSASDEGVRQARGGAGGCGGGKPAQAAAGSGCGAPAKGVKQAKAGSGCGGGCGGNCGGR